MIMGRPTNLFLSMVGGILNALVLVAAALHYYIDGAVVAAINGAFISVIAFVAWRPPTMNPGDTFFISTPTGQPSAMTTVATPPAHDPPPVAVPK